MPETATIQDVIALAVPVVLEPVLADPDARVDLVLQLEKIAHASVKNQYLRKPKALSFDAIDWLITNDPDDVERFQPAHDCAACRAGNDQALAFLRENPGRYVALGNITYTEFWED